MATNVQIPIDNAGIGDAIAIKNNTTGEDKSHFICVVGSTVTATAPSGYTWYGTVYGRERGGLMVQAITYFTEQWANMSDYSDVGITSSSHPNVYTNTTSDGGIMRNGLTNYNNKAFVAINIGEVARNNNVSINSSTALHPTSPLYKNGEYPMNKATFDLDTNKAKAMYGTYENYLAQMLPIMKGSNSGVFSKRCGKQNTKELATTNSPKGYSFPAAQRCYNLKIAHENANHWWLPDMYELAVMMRDNSYERWKYAHGTLGGYASNGFRWASMQCLKTHAWCYGNVGMSDYFAFSNPYFVCPVTLIPL